MASSAALARASARMTSALLVHTNGFGAALWRVEIGADGLLQFGDAGKGAAADALSGDLGEEALDEV